MKKPIYRILINWYQASDKDLPGWLERACQKDTELSQEKALGDELTQTLQKRPNGIASPEGDSMAARVLRQIAEEDYLAERESEASAGWGAWIRNSGMAIAAFAVALAAYQFLDTSTGIGEGEGGLAVITENAASTEGLIDISEDWKNPLDQEIEYIVSDAKGALGFLATTFVPSSYLAEEDNA